MLPKRLHGIKDMTLLDTISSLRAQQAKAERLANKVKRCYYETHFPLKKASGRNAWKPCFFSGAEGRTRTGTVMKPLDFELDTARFSPFCRFPGNPSKPCNIRGLEGFSFPIVLFGFRLFFGGCCQNVAKTNLIRTPVSGVFPQKQSRTSRFCQCPFSLMR